MTAVRYAIDGIDQAIGQLRAVERKVQKKVLRKATRAAGKPVHEEARRLAPRVNGFFRMTLKLVVKSGKQAVYARIGQEKNRQFKRKRFKGSNINRRGYAAPIWWIERGTKRHAIVADKTLAWSSGRRKGSKGKMNFAKKVNHPGMRAKNLLERAGRAASGRAATAFNNVVRDEMTKLPAPSKSPQ